jgi:hypothetical protein
METRAYWWQSDRAFNPNFNRLRCEPAWVLRQEELLLGTARERPPDQALDKRRRRRPSQETAPSHEITKTPDYSPHKQNTEAVRQAAEALFAPSGER